ncbi:MAG: hypothetical protein EOP45_16435 [Sphingobacteriaceae bacterium]|nr:MAG: hypothetical protein EOP45_16435 [Sphingobacteriaceae bacterium]
MQTPEFNKLISNQDAKWAQLPPRDMYQEKLTKEELRKEIEYNEEPVPVEIRKEIYEMVTRMKKEGHQLRVIKKAVATKFNIEVV